MLKIIAIGDPHFQTDNILEVELFINRIEELCRKQKANFIVILGDLLHTHERLHTIPLNKAYDFVDRMRKISETIVLVGNHDYISNQEFLSKNHWMDGMKEWSNVTIVDKIIIKELDGFKFVFTPYVYLGRFLEALNTSNYDWKKATCIFAHQEFYNCKMGAILSIEGDRWPLDYPQIVSGHIHSNQTPQKNIYYPGASMQHAFGESENTIIPILTWEKKNKPYHLEEIDLGLPKKKIIYTDVDRIEDLKLPQTQDKIKITLSGVYDDFKAFKKTRKYKELIQEGRKVVFKPKRTTKNDNEEENIEQTDKTNFTSILSALINKSKNPFLNQAYELIINNKEINEDDVIFL